MFGFRLGAAEPGNYEIVMALRDDLAGRSFELREPFKVIEPLPPSAMREQPAAATPPAETTPPAATTPSAAAQRPPGN
jgi:hypothetical protein